MREGKIKYFPLMSECEDGFSWNIGAQVYDNGSFATKGKIQIRDNSRDYQERKEYYNTYYIDHRIEILEDGYCRNRTEAFKEYQKRMRPRYREYNKNYRKRWRRTLKGIECLRDSAKKRRRFGSILLNSWALGTQGHHVDDTHVIFIPTEVHQSFCGHSREEHRHLVDEWMRKIHPDLYLLVHSCRNE